MFKKIGIVTLGLVFTAGSAFGNAKFLDRVEEAFGKPGFVEIKNNPKNKWRNVNFKNFNYKKFNKLSTKDEKKIYLSNYLKLKDLLVYETKTGAFIVKSRDGVKQAAPVFKESIPNDLREQIVVLIKTVPTKIKARNLDKSLRSLYSKDGDLKPVQGTNKLIITDWVSNQRKMIDLIDKL